MINLKIVYEDSWIVNYVYRVSERMRNKVTDTARMEGLMLERVSRYIKDDPNKLSHRRVLMKLVNGVVGQCIKENKTEDYLFFSQINTEKRENGEDEEVEFEPEDVLANVESEILKKETAELLAQDDRRKKKIIEFWAAGNTNDALISRTLASYLGGNEETHRKYIQRFRKSCREQLSAVI